jgi:methylenetetrahydrofolate--tRNA-(uracil-5-)-methyltransferase
MIPGLENAEFAKLGGIHKNTYIKSPLLLSPTLQLKSMPHIYFAGQITGCEGYIESAAIGLLAGYFISVKKPLLPPRTSALGSMLSHLTDDIGDYKPMNINFGLFPTLTHNKDGRRIKGAARKQEYCRRALEDITPWLKEIL